MGLQDYLTSKEQFRLNTTILEALQCHSIQTGSPCLVYTTMPQLPDNFIFLNYPTDKHFILDPNLQATGLQASLDGRTITFTLTSRAVAPFVFLNLRDHTHGYFSDNGFVMVEQEKQMIYYSRDAMTAAEFASQLDITSLFDVTPFADDDHDHGNGNGVAIGVGVASLLLSVIMSFANSFM